MRKKSLINNKYFLIAIFVLLIGGVSVGFAALRATLKINGKAKIGDVSWDVHFTNVDHASYDSTNAVQTTTNCGGNEQPECDVLPYILDDTTKAAWTITLKQPGDKYKFSIDVYNAGSLDAKLTGITADNITPSQNKYLTYTITSTNIDNTGGKLPALPTNDVVTAGNDETLVLKAGKKYSLTFEIKFKDASDLESTDLPSENQTITLGYQLDFEQNS